MAPTSLCSPHGTATDHARRLKPRATWYEADLRRLDEAAPAAFVTVAGGFSPSAAHATRADAAPIVASWAALPCPAEDDDPAPAAVIEPATLALIEPAEARVALAGLSRTQRVAQAVAQAAWLADFGYEVTHTEILASWAAA
jgi:hypothetical protein